MKMDNLISNSDTMMSTSEEIRDGFSTGDQGVFEIAKNLPSSMISTEGVEIKSEIKIKIRKEICDEFSTEEQCAFDF